MNSPQDQEERFLGIVPVNILVVSDDDDDDDDEDPDFSRQSGTAADETLAEGGVQKQGEQKTPCWCGECQGDTKVLCRCDAPPSHVADRNVKLSAFSGHHTAFDKPVVAEHQTDCSSSRKIDHVECSTNGRYSLRCRTKLSADSMCLACKHTSPKVEPSPLKLESAQFEASVLGTRGNRTHVGYIHTCQQCSYVTKNFYSFSCHMRRMHTAAEKPYCCQSCNAAFCTISHMNQHKQTCICLKGTDTLRPSMMRKCEQRAYSTHQPYNLRVHKQIHTGKRPYKCLKCELAFRTPSHLRHHQTCHRNKLQ